MTVSEEAGWQDDFFPGPLDYDDTLHEPLGELECSRVETGRCSSMQQAANGLHQPDNNSNSSADNDNKADGEPGDRNLSRQQALQEKNRKAQKRFRQRQKAKMKSMEEQLEELTDELQRLRQDNELLQTRNIILEKALALREEQLKSVSQDKPQGKVPAFENWASKDLLPVKSEGGQFSMLQAETSSTWRETVQLLAGLLNQAQGGGGRVSHTLLQRLSTVAEQAAQACLNAAMLTSGNPRKPLLQFSMEDTQAHGQGISHRDAWAAVVAQLQLTLEQQQEVLHARIIYLQELQSIQEARKQLNLRAQCAMPQAIIEAQGVHLMSQKSHDCMLELKQNMAAEANANRNFVSSIFQKILSPVQFAQCAVQAFPAQPDALAIANSIAATFSGEGLYPQGQQAFLQQQAPALGGSQHSQSPRKQQGGISPVLRSAKGADDAGIGAFAQHTNSPFFQSPPAKGQHTLWAPSGGWSGQL